LFSHSYLGSLAFSPVPVLALVLALLLELLDVVAKGITVVFGPVVTPTGVFSEVVTDVLGDFVHFLNRLVWVLTPVRVVTAGIDGRNSEKESLEEMHDKRSVSLKKFL
jgi:hypothetical protein